jgi:hypothetical protein
LVRSKGAIHSAMPKSKRPPRKQPSKLKAATRAVETTSEEQAAVAITVAWTVSVSAVLMADLATIVVHFYRLANPESKPAEVFVAIMLLTACVIGLVSLALMPVVWHVRRVRPPKGFAVFAGSVAAAPVLVAIYRLLN